MTKQVENAVKLIEDNGWIRDLRSSSGLKERHGKLMELLPEIRRWNPLPARQLVFSLSKEYQLDFGVCPFYEIEGDRQYCTVDGERIECLCVIPQPFCVFRDKGGKPKYPEFMPSFRNGVVD